MIIDFHTHIFGPDVRDRRDDYARRDPTFAEMYSDPKAKIAIADDLLASMDAAGVDVCVALGFAWRDDADVFRHNDYLLEAAASSKGRIVPFTTVNMASAAAESEIERCVALAGEAQTVSIEMLSDDVRGKSAAPGEAPALSLNLPLAEAVDELKRNMIQAALAATGSKTQAAQKLGIPRQSLQKMMKRLEMSDET